MSHQKRQKISKNWPIERKGTAFVVNPNSNKEKGIPILIVLRNLLKVAQTRKEVKKAIQAKNILINGRAVRDEKNSVLLFDTIDIVPAKKAYRLILSEKGKFDLEETNEKDAFNKISKIIDKKTLKGKKIQINLSDGRNYISELKCNTNDSVVIDFKKKVLSKVLPLKEKSKALVFAGKHAGKNGIIEKIDSEAKMVKLKVKDETLNILIKQIIIIE